MKKILLVVAGALIDSDGRVLLSKRKQSDAEAGKWEFPGGKLGQNETPEAGLVRELNEELGIEIDPRCLAPVAFASEDLEGFHLLMPLFVCRKWTGTPKPLEAEELRWVQLKDLSKVDLLRADVSLAVQIRDVL